MKENKPGAGVELMTLVNMTTPKAEAMEKAREIARELLGNNERYERIRQDLIAILEPLLSAEKERDELRAKLKDNDEWCDDYRQSMENAEKLIQDQNIELAVKNLKIAELEEKLRAFLAKQGERI